uniref:C-C motif chemokine n=1 Tax=Equus caballus TaxID=9796 RepID=A0A5F5PT78_HORSE
MCSETQSSSNLQNSFLILSEDSYSQNKSPTQLGSDPPTACCFSYTLRKLPRNFVVDYYETSSLCSQPAVVFQTKKGRQVCANPSDDWVQEYMDDLELN